MKTALLIMLVPLAAMLIVIGYTRRFGELWTASLGQAQRLLPLLVIAVLFAACVEVLSRGPDIKARILPKQQGE